MRIMDMYGSPMQGLILSLIRPPVIGYSPTMAGHGYLISNGAGHRFIMAGGITTTIMDGSGCLIPNGVLPGSTGGNLMGIMVGHPCSQE